MTEPITLKAHAALNLRIVKKSIQFYRKLFGIDPCKPYDKYAKFDIQDPPLNLTLNERPFIDSGALFHMDIQVASTAAVFTIRERWQRASLETKDEMQVVCGHALQDKTRTTDPDGINWEAFVVHQDNLPVFRDSLCSDDKACKPVSAISEPCETAKLEAAPSAQKGQFGLTLRKLTEQDWNDVQTIYEEGIATGHATFQQKSPSWQEWDQSHLSTCRLVAVKENKVVGWGALTPISDRCHYSGIAEVSIYVKSSHRRQRLGKALLEALVIESESAGIWTLQSGIFPEKIASVALHKRCGFREVGGRERIGNLKGVWRDTLLLERRSTTVGQQDKL